MNKPTTVGGISGYPDFTQFRKLVVVLDIWLLPNLSDARIECILSNLVGSF